MDNIAEDRECLVEADVLTQIRGINVLASDWIESRLGEWGFFAVTVAGFCASADVEAPLCESILEVLASARVLNRVEEFRCQCGGHVSPADETCPRCDRDLLATPPISEISYQRSVPPGRDVPWMLLIHGMNTSGRWQEDFSWRAALLHGRSIPIFSYKYGRIRPGVAIPVRRNQLVKRTRDVLRELAGDADDIHLGPRPDVVAHSFGTWLIVHTLLNNPTIQIGRLILIGSVVPPDFEWDRITGQHLGVLNHVCGKDRIVGLAKFFIGGSGPSGVVGFQDPRIEQKTSESWGHRDCFKTRNDLVLSFREIWGPFLTRPFGNQNAFE